MHEDLNLKTLSEWLRRQNCIPPKKGRKETLLDIAGVEHLENHWSYIYMYFFSPNGTHGMSRLFIDTLQDLICKKGKKEPLVMKSFSVLREDAVPDEKGNKKRIDLLLQNDEEAIIIENKVYAKLYNRLDLYWKKPEVPEENKRGVVLSLWRTKPTHKNFVNITHEEFAKALEKKLPSYFLSAQPKALILLQDFIQNIYNVTHSMNEEELLFYFKNENREKINRLAEIRKNVITHLWKTIEDASLLKPLFAENRWKLSVRTKNNVNYVYYAFDDMPDCVMITLVYDSLWNYSKECRIRMFLEIGTNDMISFVGKHAQDLQKLGIEPDGHKKESSWWHYKGYEIPFTPEELLRKNVIVEKIVNAISDSGFYKDGMEIINLKKGINI